ncbi:MAG: aldose 1-epimerase [Phenylobacterium sp.]
MPDVVALKAPSAAGPGFIEAQVLPGRGMMLLQARVRLASGEIIDALHVPADGLSQLDGGPEDFAGNKGFAFGGAILAPYANRIRGRPLTGSREIETQVGGRTVRLPRNWGGKAPGAEQYAMHGLILDAPIPFERRTADRVTGRLEAGDFGGRWPSRTALSFEWALEDGALVLRMEARNVGDDTLPMGLGWHPYLALPSGDRRQARLRLLASKLAEINDYDEVLPTGRLLDVAGTPFDFNGGPALGDLYLDDCFTDLAREDGLAVVEVVDPAAGLGYRVTSSSPAVTAIQVFAPTDGAFVVVEPQFNLADPFGAAWGRTDTGMVRLPPGGSVAYEARLAAFAVGT